MVVESNKLSDKIEIIKNKMEDVELPEKVDVIVSEVPHFLFTILYF
jgi:predicted metallopeptidase